MPASWKPYLLYRLASPYSRLYVEVDAVKGCEPDEAKLQKLREVLSTYCNKPDGIEIVRSDVIPIEAAKGMTPRALGDRYMNGPNTNGAPAAFLYVLYYDDGYSEEVASKKSRRGRTNPFTEILDYPAIYINVAYGIRFAGHDFGFFKNEFIAHEAGHVLGVGRRTGVDFGYHCTNRTCLMYPVISFRRWMFGSQRKFCPECLAELARGATEAPLTNVHYAGEVLVRSETEYDVLTLPFNAQLMIGGASEKDCQEFATRVHARKLDENANEMRIDCTAPNEFLDDAAKVCRVMNCFSNDFSGLVREYGPKLCAQAAIQSYAVGGQSSNAVPVLQQAIRINPKDDWSYNALAWLRATHPEDSMRNGSEAVEAARKACELTKWEDGRYIDTLAAAYAETGDFKQAVAFEEQALKAGKLSELEKKEGQERLALYREGKPFREKAKENAQAAGGS